MIDGYSVAVGDELPVIPSILCIKTFSCAGIKEEFKVQFFFDLR